ncbi:MAG: ABC transporter permease [Anaerovorax sp.]
MHVKNAKKIIWPVITLVVLMALWEFFVRITETPLYILPAPSKIFSTLLDEAPILWGHSLITLEETFLGLGIAIVLSFVLSILMDHFEGFKLAAYPILVVSQTIPVIVLAPIFIIYMGFGIGPKILTVVLMCFFPIAVSLTDGMAQANTDQINLVRSFGANPFQVYTFVKLPSAMSSLFSGLKVAATYSITGAVVGEWLSSNSGLGYYMIRVKNGFMLDKVFACILVIIILSLFMNGIVKVLSLLFLPHEKRERRES